MAAVLVAAIYSRIGFSLFLAICARRVMVPTGTRDNRIRDSVKRSRMIGRDGIRWSQISYRVNRIRSIGRYCIRWSRIRYWKV